MTDLSQPAETNPEQPGERAAGPSGGSGSGQHTGPDRSVGSVGSVYAAGAVHAVGSVRKIIHIDMDAFYASVEQRDEPSYRNKPVIVGGSPQGRGVVAAASYEARKYGIRSAMPAIRAIKKCPHAIFVKPRFDVYKEVSRGIRKIFDHYTDLVEPLSLDEAYLDVTHPLAGPPSATLIAKEIKQKIKSELNLVASAGVSYNKFLAKIASDLDKPDGLAVILPEEAPSFLRSLPIGKFYGVGKATRQRMENLGIRTGEDLLRWSEEDLAAEFGKAGRQYYHIVRGVDERDVKPHRIRKSVGKERTFSEDVDDPDWIRTYLEELAARVSESMKRLGAAGKTITLKIRYDNFETVTRSLTQPDFVDEASDIAKTAQSLLQETEVAYRPVRLVGISMSSLNLTEEGRVARQMEIPFA